MLANYKGTKAKTVFQLVLFNVPLEKKDEQQNEEENWTKDLLFLLIDAMELDADLVDAYYPLTVAESPSSPTRSIEELLSITKPYVDTLEMSYVERLNFATILMLFFVINRKYDGKGRTCIKQLMFTLGLARDDFYYVENRLGTYLRENAAKVDGLVKVGKKKDTTKKMIRYAKIGTVALGAGAVLAVTGGLAAPAIAGALIVMGSSSAAALVSVGAMAGIFGGAGAGLAGYKMMKRTKTLNEFEFEQHGEKGHLAIMVMVSGWMKKENDYQRAFGVIPDTLPLHERLGRYYFIHCPHRLPKVSMEASMFEKDPDSLFDQLMDLYGADPRDSNSLMPPQRKSLNTTKGVEECFQKVIEFVEQLTTKHSFFSGFKGNQKETAASSASPNAEKEQDSNSHFEQPHHVIADQVEAPLISSVDQMTVNAADATEPMPLVQQDGYTSFTHSSSDDEEEDGLSPDGTVSTTTATPIPSPDTVIVTSTTNSTNTNSAESEKEEVVSYDYWHWQNVPESHVYELYLLRWDPKLQLQLGDSIASMLRGLGSAAVQNVLAATVLTALASAVLLPAVLLKLTDVIDNLFFIAARRADEAGVELAKALLQRAHGNRPVTLVGYSFGARVIFSCLRELARLTANFDVAADEREEMVDEASSASPDQAQEDDHENESESLEAVSKAPSSTIADTQSAAPHPPPPPPQKRSSFSSYFFSSSTNNKSSTINNNNKTTKSSVDTSGANEKESSQEKEKDKEAILYPADIATLIQDVVLLGAPINARSKVWSILPHLVGGRVINGYSTNDMVLSIIYRYQRFKFSVCGVTQVTVPGIENINLSKIVDNHTDYGNKIKDILEAIQLQNVMVVEAKD